MNHQYTFQFENLLLRPLKAEDILILLSWRNKDDIRKNFIHSAIIKKDEQILWYEHYLNNPNDLMFIFEETQIYQKPIGAVGLYNVHRNNAEFGRLMIGEGDALGKGFGYLATLMTCYLGFSKLDLAKIHLKVFSDNQAAWRLYQKIGFVNRDDSNTRDRIVISMTLTKQAFYDIHHHFIQQIGVRKI